MTIIFNFPALILFIIILLIRHFISYLSPELDSFFHPYSWLIFYVVSGLGEIVKLKGRLFWIPMWLIGFVGVVFSSYMAFSSTGFYGSTAILLGLYAIGFIVLRKLTILNWNKAKESLKLIKSNSPQDKGKQFLKAFYVPSYLNPEGSLQYILFGKIYEKIYKKWMSNSEVNKHYIDTIDYLKEYISEQEYNKNIAVFRNSIAKITENKIAYIEQYMFQNIIKLIKKTKF